MIKQADKTNSPRFAHQSMTYYINREEGRYHETVDQFDSKAEALAMKAEYQLSEFGRAYFYVSQTARPGWED